MSAPEPLTQSSTAEPAEGPFPHEPFGAFIGYKTDHDPYERATSAGPKTSKFMSECLQARAERMGISIIDKHPVVEFVTEGDGDEKQRQSQE